MDGLTVYIVEDRVTGKMIDLFFDPRYARSLRDKNSNYKATEYEVFEKGELDA